MKYYLLCWPKTYHREGKRGIVDWGGTSQKVTECVQKVDSWVRHLI